jgi:membrane protease YdiL (CAAX protease family)
MISFLNSLLQVLIIAIAVILIRPKKDGYTTYLLLFVAIFLIEDIISGGAAGFAPFAKWGLHDNWIGKILALLFLLLVVYGFRFIAPKEAFVTFKTKASGSKQILLLVIVYFFIRLGIYLFTQENKMAFHTEEVLFQATLPGIEEELLFRGILLGLLNKIFTRKRLRFFGVSFGWGVILTSILFSLVHGLHFGNNMHLEINSFAIARTLIDGFIFALLTEKYKSILPAIIFHNVLNLIGNH